MVDAETQAILPNKFTKRSVVEWLTQNSTNKLNPLTTHLRIKSSVQLWLSGWPQTQPINSTYLRLKHLVPLWLSGWPQTQPILPNKFTKRFVVEWLTPSSTNKLNPPSTHISIKSSVQLWLSGWPKTQPINSTHLQPTSGWGVQFNCGWVVDPKLNQ